MSDDKAILGSLMQRLRGTCRICGCHGDSCTLPEGGGERCVFVDAIATLCSNPKCLVEAGRAKRKHKWAVEDMVREAKRARRKRGRAA